LSLGNARNKRRFGGHFAALCAALRTYSDGQDAWVSMPTPPSKFAMSHPALPLFRRLAEPPPASAWALSCLFLVSVFLWPLASHAQTGGNAELQQIARDFVQPALSSATDPNGSPLRAEVVMGSLDTRLRLAPCNRVEAHLPTGTRLWGRSRIGLRCVDGPTRWNVFVPVTVKAWGPAWVIRQPVASGAVLSQEDAEMAEIDWAEHSASVLASPALWVGQQAAFALQPGQALRQNMVRAAPAFAAGALVKVSAAGTGFQVVVTGEALSPGLTGQTARVKLPGGKVVTGLVRGDQSVEIGL
jgi:flagella basal body P-ring formation protein FlgA